MEVKRNSVEEVVDDMLYWIHYNLQHPDFYAFPLEMWALHLLVNPDPVNLKDKKIWLQIRSMMLSVLKKKSSLR